MLTASLGDGNPPITRIGFNCICMPRIYGAADNAQSIAMICRALDANVTANERNQPATHTTRNW